MIKQKHVPTRIVSSLMEFVKVLKTGERTNKLANSKIEVLILEIIFLAKMNIFTLVHLIEYTFHYCQKKSLLIF